MPWYPMLVTIGTAPRPSTVMRQYLCGVMLMTRNPSPKLSTSSDAVFAVSVTARTTPRLGTKLGCAMNAVASL